MLTAVAVLLKPFVLALLLLPGAVAKVLVRRYMRDGWLKRFLLR